MKFIITAILTALATLATALPVLDTKIEDIQVITETMRNNGLEDYTNRVANSPRQDPEEEEDECHKNWAFLCD